MEFTSILKKNIDLFVLNANKLIGEKCWSTIAGKGTGSNVSIDIGRKILRKQSIKNDYLSEDQKKYVGEFSLYVTCSWRLDSIDSVICSSKDSNEQNGPMVCGLKRLIGRKIIKVDVITPALDLVLCFDGSLCLRVFCDETDPDDEFDNYSIFTPHNIYTVKNRSILLVETR